MKRTVKAQAGIRNPAQRMNPRVVAHGFTLLEMILAVGLTTLLMAALYSSMSIYWNTATESYTEIERTQIARALLRNMARDIRSCTFIEKELVESDEDSVESESDPVTAADDAIAAYTDGLFGTERDLVLYLNRPTRNTIYLSPQELTLPSDRSSDAEIVRYLLVEEGGGGLSGQLASDPLLSDVDDPVKGLALMEGDMLGLSNAILNGDLDMQVAASRVLATEVGGLRFQYFDGVEYRDEWDSTVENSMPTAVVIELTLRTLPDPNWKGQPEDQPGYLPPTLHRVVVPILVAKPYVGEAAL